MTGLDKARETATKLKDQSEKEKIEKAKGTGETALTEHNPEWQRLMAADARQEMESSGGSLPFLKVYVANRSQVTLADGREPTNGWFFYVPTREQYQEVYCHVLHISRGFRAEGMANEEGIKKDRYNQIVAGIILNDEPKPFWMFISGQARIQKLWEFQKQLRTLNAAHFPTFPLLVKLTTEKVKTEKSPAIVVNFAVQLTDDGKPEMNLSYPEYMELRNQAHKQEKYVGEYIVRKEVTPDEPADLPPPDAPPVLPEGKDPTIPF